MIHLLLIILAFIGTPLAQFPEKEFPPSCGINELSNIPADARRFNYLDRDREMQYDIGLAFHIIYGEYALTDITLHLTINAPVESGNQSAGFLLYDMFKIIKP